MFLPCANNKGADQPAHPRHLISTFVVRCLDSIIPLVSISEISSLYLASVAAQAGLCLPGRKLTKTGFPMTGLSYIHVYHNDPNFLDRQVLANSVDPDQTEGTH